MTALQAVDVGGHTLAVPGRHEGRALTDNCPDVHCQLPSTPVVVLDETTSDGDLIRRVAAYRCPCGNRWLCNCSPPGQLP